MMGSLPLIVQELGKVSYLSTYRLQQKRIAETLLEHINWQKVRVGIRADLGNAGDRSLGIDPLGVPISMLTR